MSINIVIATIGRPSLRRMIESLADQVHEDDCVTLLCDGITPPDYIFQLLACNVVAIANLKKEGYWGHGIRNKYQSGYYGDWIINADDDDIFLPEALDSIRQKAIDQSRLYLFRFRHMGQGGKVYWHTAHKENWIGNIGTPCMVYSPNVIAPPWAYEYGGDGIFAQELASKLDPVYVNKIIYEAY